MGCIVGLVGGLEHVSFFPSIGNIIIPIDSHFSDGRYTINQMMFIDVDEYYWGPEFPVDVENPIYSNGK